MFDIADGYDDKAKKGILNYADCDTDDGKLCGLPKGFNWGLLVYDVYAKNADFKTMRDDQLDKLQKRGGYGNQFLFLLSWTLTGTVGNSRHPGAVGAQQPATAVLPRQDQEGRLHREGFQEPAERQGGQARDRLYRLRRRVDEPADHRHQQLSVPEARVGSAATLPPPAGAGPVIALWRRGAVPAR